MFFDFFRTHKKPDEPKSEPASMPKKYLVRPGVGTWINGSSEFSQIGKMTCGTYGYMTPNYVYIDRQGKAWLDSTTFVHSDIFATAKLLVVRKENGEYMIDAKYGEEKFGYRYRFESTKMTARQLRLAFNDKLIPVSEIR